MNIKTMRMIENRILVLPDEPETMKGGMVLPENYIPVSTRGVVVAVGKGKYSTKGVRIPPEVSVGDRVMFSIYMDLPGMSRVINGKKHVFMRDSDCEAIVG